MFLLSSKLIQINDWNLILTIHNFFEFMMNYFINKIRWICQIFNSFMFNGFFMIFLTSREGFMNVNLNWIWNFLKNFIKCCMFAVYTSTYIKRSKKFYLNKITIIPKFTSFLIRSWNWSSKKKLIADVKICLSLTK